MNYWTQSEKNIFVAAHRGWSAKYPENTMEAFHAALELGVDQLETDIHMTADGRLVLMHDPDVTRTTDGTGLIKDKTFAEIKKLDAGIWKGLEFEGYRVPEMVELMELIKDHPTLTMNFELKDCPTSPENEQWAYDECDMILEIIDDYGYTDRCVINSFNAKLHQYIYEKYGDKYKHHVYWPTEYNKGDYTLDPYSYAYCCCMFGKPYMATEEEFKAMREKGVRTWAGAGVKDAGGVDAAISHGAELITCNDPDVILKLLRERGYHA